MPESAPAAAPVELTLKLSIIEARNVVGLAGPNAAFNACASTNLRGDSIETTIVPLSSEPGVHRFDHSHELLFNLNPVRAR